MVLWIETDLDNSLMNDGTVVILAAKVSGSPVIKGEGKLTNAKLFKTKPMRLP